MTRVLGFALAALLLFFGGGVVACVALLSQWGDPSPAAAIMRNERTEAVVVFMCDQGRPRRDCTGHRLPPRSTAYVPVAFVGHDYDSFTGAVIVTTDTCEILWELAHSGDGDVAVVVTEAGVQARTDISPYSERHAPGFSVAPGSPARASCKLAGIP